jgi:release factor glutamine methyltransferase
VSLLVSGQELFLWRHQAKQAAIAAQVSPDEVDWLLCEVAGLERLELHLESFREQPLIELKQPFSLLLHRWQRRLQERLPIQYVAGVVPWRNFSLKVSPSVLIPRSETESLIDLVAQSVQKRSTSAISSGHWVDLGTGSGAIAIGLAEVLTNATIHAVDCSLAALTIAQHNAESLEFAQRIQFYQGSWWSPLDTLKGQVSGMVSNPPYIPTALIAALQPEVTKHEPHLALDGGRDGLDCIRQLVNTSPDYLCSGGVWAIEMMAGQAEQVTQLLYDQGSYFNIQIFPDLAGIERFALAYRR